ncbi:MAG: electron transfer flavoprotein subunit alpha/FixB family protein [Cytophagales bacterium]|nr:electron transfer flavoprotein subunit alpha/FixB family protein [Cytophagales bacterium]
MSIVAFIEREANHVKSASREAACCASQLAKKKGTRAIGLAVGTFDDGALQSLADTGLEQIYHVSDERLNGSSASRLAAVVHELMNQEDSEILVMVQSALSNVMGGRLAVKQKAAFISNVVECPELTDTLECKRSVYSGKAFSVVSANTSKIILALRKNAVTLQTESKNLEIVPFSVPDISGVRGAEVLSREKAEGGVLLSDAEIVVSGGRGLKGPENWGIIEQLARSLHAATACSKPVSDMDWRPHHEHVGQTGVKISPSLYIAVGISGAIQHLAGVNASKVIVVINKDPEAPFFKEADYGVVGDAFEVVPRLTAAVEALKSKV